MSQVARNLIKLLESHSEGNLKGRPLILDEAIGFDLNGNSVRTQSRLWNKFCPFNNLKRPLMNILEIKKASLDFLA